MEDPNTTEPTPVNPEDWKPPEPQAREEDPAPEFTECYKTILAAFPNHTTHTAWPGGVPMVTVHTTLDGKEYVGALIPTDN